VNSTIQPVGSGAIIAFKKYDQKGNENRQNRRTEYGRSKIYHRIGSSDFDADPTEGIEARVNLKGVLTGMVVSSLLKRCATRCLEQILLNSRVRRQCRAKGGKA
jgi:hypothetical protein